MPRRRGRVPRRPPRCPEDTPATAVAGNPFTIPTGWPVSVKGPATIIAPPEGDSHIVYVDVETEDAESALAKA